VAGLTGLTLLLFGSVLTSRDTILSSSGMDLARQFIYWRQFAAHQLRQGHLPLWNPYTFGGAPYLGWAQTAPLYPMNWLDLVLPLPVSVNLGIAVHVLLAGVFTFAWAVRRRLHPLAAFVSGAAYMFGGTYFLHVYAGHLTLIAAFAWAPLVFLCCDGIVWTGRPGWMLLGVAAVAMQIYAGDPQCTFYTAIAAGLYSLAQLWRQLQRARKIALLLGTYLGAAAVGAVCLLTTWQAATESTRGGGLDFGRSASFFFPTENFLSLVVPGFFGDMVSFPYWGRWYLWETTFFVGVGTLVLAVIGLFGARHRLRGPLTVVIVVLVLLSLGAQTPVYGWGYRWLPGIDRFRVPARFLVPASMCLALLAGVGLDSLAGRHWPRRWLILGLAGTAVIGLGAAIILHQQVFQQVPGSLWSRMVTALASGGHTALSAPTYSNPRFLTEAGRHAVGQLAVSAAILLGFAGALVFVCWRAAGVSLIAALVVGEVFFHAWQWRATFAVRETRSPELERFLAAHPGDARMLPWKPNLAMAAGREEIWGASPLALRRYVDFIVFSQLGSLDTMPSRLEFNGVQPMFRLLRCRYSFLSDSDGLRYVEQTNVLERVQLVHNYSVVTNASDVLQTLNADTFDGRQTVILETVPDPVPDPTVTAGSVRVLESTTDELTIEADLPAAAVLLVTETYSRGWRVRSLLPQPRQNYAILPADYVLRAVPLAGGHHLLRMEYRPLAFVIGRWVSVAAIGAYLLGLGFWMRQQRRSRL
jgi:hypothetical protein